MSVRGAEGQVDETQGELNPGFSSFELSDALKKEIAFFAHRQKRQKEEIEFRTRTGDTSLNNISDSKTILDFFKNK